jgi:hypothetical protein
MSTKFYFIFHKATGDLRSLASVDPTNTVSDFESCVEVTDEYLEFYNDLFLRKKKLTNYRIDLESKVLKVNDKFDVSKNPNYNKFYKINYSKDTGGTIFEVLLKIISKDNKPYMCLKINDNIEIDRNKTMKVYATHFNDINILHETFYFEFDKLDENKQIFLPIKKIPFELLYRSKFSLYTRKVFKSYGFYIE